MQPATQSLKLSICITTLNRAEFIGATLESILAQATKDCEVIVLDAGSSDDTERVVSEYARRFGCLTYIQQGTNNGIDRDYDSAVKLASGEYCWFMTDDDPLKPGAVSAVLSALNRHPSVVIMNVELRDVTLRRVVQPRWLDVASDCVYEPEEGDRLFVDLGERLWYIGGFIIRRSIWLDRERDPYLGSWFVYVGVIFQRRLPGATIVISRPFITFRLGNTHTFSPRLFEIIWFAWPSLVWSLAVSEAAKKKVCSIEPWRNSRELLLYRGLGCYSLNEYRTLIRPRLRGGYESWVASLIAVFPGVVANALLVLYYSLSKQRYHGWRQPSMMLYMLAASRFHFRRMKVFKSQALRGGGLIAE